MGFFARKKVDGKPPPTQPEKSSGSTPPSSTTTLPKPTIQTTTPAPAPAPPVATPTTEERKKKSGGAAGTTTTGKSSKKKTKETRDGTGNKASTAKEETSTRIIGDTKRVTTKRIEENGTAEEVLTVSKLTEKEQQERVDPKKSSAPTSTPTLKPTPPAAAVAGPQPTIQNIPVGDSTLATIDVTRDLVKGFIADIWNRGDIELISKICSPNLRFNGHVGMDKVGHEGFCRMVTTVREALTDYHCEIHSMVVENNKAFCRLKFTGKHTGTLLGYPPTGRTVQWVGASEFTCKNGKILKVWELGDVKSLEAQLSSKATI